MMATMSAMLEFFYWMVGVLYYIFNGFPFDLTHSALVCVLGIFIGVVFISFNNIFEHILCSMRLCSYFELVNAHGMKVFTAPATEVVNYVKDHCFLKPAWVDCIHVVVIEA